jgi:4-alpha-glucanotransferase
MIEKLNFHLKYKTNFGQAIFITGNHPLLGNGNIEQAIPMVYLNEDYWVLHLATKGLFKEGAIQYSYFIQNEDGTRTFDWGTDKSIMTNQFSTKELVLIDTWNFTGYIDNAFYTAPFANVLLPCSDTAVDPMIPGKNATHLFRVKAPLLKPDQTICILGESKEIGGWNAAKALPLKRIKDQPYFEIDLDLSECDFPLVYKYGIYDTMQKKFISFESGNNRVLYEPVGKNKLVLVQDGFAQVGHNQWKGAGVAIPVFSLRSNQSIGVGEFSDIKLLADWSKKIGLKLIQLLPINDTTATHSWMDSYPYAAISAFALHPMYIRLSELVDANQSHLIQDALDQQIALNNLTVVDYEAVLSVKWKALKAVYAINGKRDLATPSFKQFFKDNQTWLVPYSAFSYLRDLHGSVDFNAWPSYAKFNTAEIDQLADSKSKTYSDIAFFYFVQYHLHLQLKAATDYAHAQGVVLKGDIPIGVYRFGADAWQHPHLFHMDKQAGAPPDDFAVSGQNWGFPTYNWDQMAADGFAWWKSRFDQMKYYFDAFRIDHILGFFRIWSIPMHAVEGILGHFVPAIPININELNAKGIAFDHYRFTMPYINETILFQVFGYDNNYVKSNFLESIGDEHFALLPAFKTQRAVEAYFEQLEQTAFNSKIKQGLYDLISNVILLEGDQPQAYHFRFNIGHTSSFKHLNKSTQNKLYELYDDYFFKRQDAAWEKEAMKKLPMLKRSTNMLICGEDLGLVPSCVPDVMYQLGMLSLEVQRMPKANYKTFFHPNDAPYLSVVTPSSHDTSTIRGWWEEDHAKTQQFYHYEMGQQGIVPVYCDGWINKAILSQHLYSPAMWAIFQLQDFMGIDESLRRSDPNEERINVPANPKHYWRYRIHINLEQLIEQEQFNQEWFQLIQSSGRA